MSTFLLVVLLPLWIAAPLVALTFLLSVWVFPGGGSRGPHDTFAGRMAGFAWSLLLEWVALTWLIYTLPWRWVRRRTCPAVSPGGVPVVLLAGFLESPATMWFLRWRLERRLGVPVVALRPPPCAGELTLQAARAEQQLWQLLAESGAERVDLVGHSLGGLLARQLAEKGGKFSRRVRCLATLGTPHLGTALAFLLPVHSVRQMRRGSAFLEKLNAIPHPEGVRYIGVCSTHDNLVLPWNCALSPRGDNFILRHLGHVSLLLSPQVADILVRQLKQESAAPPAAQPPPQPPPQPSP